MGRQTRKRPGSKNRTPRISAQRLKSMAVDLGALAAKVISPSDVATSEWVRWKCRYGCGGYGTSLVCPPHTPTPAETRAMLDEYSRAVLFESPRGTIKPIAVALERELFLAGYYKALGLGAGPCRLCKECALDEGCRHADEARPSMEASGIDVYATARKQGFVINVVRNDNDEQHYSGLVLVE